MLTLSLEVRFKNTKQIYRKLCRQFFSNVRCSFNKKLRMTQTNMKEQTAVYSTVKRINKKKGTVSWLVRNF